MTTSEQLHTQTTQLIHSLKREQGRLSVRQAALERCRKAALAEQSHNDVDDEDETFDAITSNIDAIEYDLATFRSQLEERLAHLEHGLCLVETLGNKKNSILFYQHILEGTKLCLRDTTVAREGYDELISNITEMTTHLRDQ
jgi:hypothetical protein